MKVTVKKQIGDFLIEVSIDGITDGVGSKVEEILDALTVHRNSETIQDSDYKEGAVDG